MHVATVLVFVGKDTGMGADFQLLSLLNHGRIGVHIENQQVCFTAQ